MISLSPIGEKQQIKEYFCNVGIAFNENCGCLTAVSNDEVLGFCLYELTVDKIEILYIYPENDIALADGILRSTLHIAAQRSIMKAYYAEKVSKKFLKITDFIKNEQNRELDIDKLFKSCQSCQKSIDK